MSSTQLIPVRAVTPTVVPQNDVIVYVPLASRTAHGIVKIGEGLNISSSGLLSLDRSEITVLKIAKNGVDIAPDENKRVNIVLNKTDVGLDKVDNTADTDKPVSTAVRAAITVVDDKLANHMKDYNNPHKVTKSQVGLDKAENTADLDKPVSTATQTALNAMKSEIDTDVLSLRNRVNDLSALLKLQDQAISFTTYGAVVSEFNSAATNKYHVGQTVFVNTKNVPDLWVYSVENTHIDYAYIGDADIIEQLEETGTVQFGYYKLAPMETQKVSFDGLVNLTEMQTITGLKLFKDQIGIKNSANGDINYIKHINNNFLISASNGENIINIDEQLKTINFYNKPLALQEYADDNFISYTKNQALTDEQKEIARNNIGAGTGSDIEIAYATTEEAGIIKIATDELATEGADDTTAITPKQLVSAINTSLGSVESWLTEINSGSGV